MLFLVLTFSFHGKNIRVDFSTLFLSQCVVGRLSVVAFTNILAAMCEAFHYCAKVTFLFEMS